MEALTIRISTSDLMTVAEAAKALGRPPVAIYRMMGRGAILTLRLGGVTYVPTSEVDRLKKAAIAGAAATTTP